MEAEQKSMEELVSESWFIPVSVGSKFVKLNDVMSDVVQVIHGEIAEGGLGITMEIIGSEVVCELLTKGRIIMEPIWETFPLAHDDGLKPI